MAIGGSSSVRWSDTIGFLIVLAAERDRALPDVPTIGKLGYHIAPINEVIDVHTPRRAGDRVAKPWQRPPYCRSLFALCLMSH